jgi:hypothetical protein
VKQGDKNLNFAGFVKLPKPTTGTAEYKFGLETPTTITTFQTTTVGIERHKIMYYPVVFET